VLSTAGPGPVAILPVLLIAGSALSLAVGSILVKRDGPFEPMKLLAWMSMLTVPQVLLMSAILESGQWASLNTATWHGWIALLYTIAAGGIAGFGIWFWLIARCSISRVAPYALLQTVFAVASGVLFLHEPLTLTLVIGMLACIAGVAMTQRRAVKELPAVKTLSA
jgi:O-acetylserine/cysteine efflux transporter